MCTHAYMCMYAHTHTRTHTHTHTHTSANTHMHLHTHTRTCAYTHTHAFLDLRVIAIRSKPWSSCCLLSTLLLMPRFAYCRPYLFIYPQKQFQFGAFLDLRVLAIRSKPWSSCCLLSTLPIHISTKAILAQCFLEPKSARNPLEAMVVGVLRVLASRVLWQSALFAQLGRSSASSASSVCVGVQIHEGSDTNFIIFLLGVVAVVFLCGVGVGRYSAPRPTGVAEAEPSPPTGTCRTILIPQPETTSGARISTQTPWTTTHRDMQTQSQCTYTIRRTQPRFLFLPEGQQNAWPMAIYERQRP